MTSSVTVILDLSDEVQELVQQQQIDLHRTIQEELPDVRLETMSDPEAPRGSKDLVTILVVATGLVSAVTPLVVRILNQFKPDTTEIMHKETESYHPDGTVTIQRIYLYTKREYNQQMQLPQLPKKPELPSPESGNVSNQTNY